PFLHAVEVQGGQPGKGVEDQEDPQRLCQLRAESFVFSRKRKVFLERIESEKHECCAGNHDHQVRYPYQARISRAQASQEQHHHSGRKEINNQNHEGRDELRTEVFVSARERKEFERRIESGEKQQGNWQRLEQ